MALQRNVPAVLETRLGISRRQQSLFDPPERQRRGERHLRIAFDDSVTDDHSLIIGNLKVRDIHRDPLQPDHRFAGPQPQADDQRGIEFLQQLVDFSIQRFVGDRQWATGHFGAANFQAVEPAHDLERRINPTAAIRFETRQQGYFAGHERNLSVIHTHIRLNSRRASSL